jgi:mono/diheme cytochrome c family protein
MSVVHDMKKMMSWSRASLRLTLFLGILLLPVSAHAQARSPAEQRGHRLAMTYCSGCHSIDKVTESPLKVAPAFRTLHDKYPLESLEEALGEGIVTGHPTMPEFRLDADQVNDFIAFLRTLER